MAKVYTYDQRTQTPTLRGVEQPRALAPDEPQFIPRALGQLSSGIRNLGEAVAQVDESQAKAWTATAISKARLEWASNLEKLKESAPPGANNFTPNTLSAFDEYASEAIETAPTPTAKAFLKAQMGVLREDIGLKSTEFEAGARVAYIEKAHDQGIRNAELLMNEDPNQYKPALAEQLALINESSLGPQTKTKMIFDAINRVSAAAVWSQIQRSPTEFLKSVGLYPQKDGRVIGDLKGVTGNTPFDALPFDTRVKYFDMAISEKARIDREADAATNGRPIKSSNAALIRLHELLDNDPVEAEKYATDALRRGILSQEDAKMGWSKAREIGRQVGPDSEYERSRRFINGSLDPGPLVQDPVGRGRLAEAVDMFDRWFISGKHTDAEVMARGREIVKQFQFINLQDTVVGLPQPRSAVIRRDTADPAGMLSDIQKAGERVIERKTKGELTQDEYESEMLILDRWRKAVTGAR